MQLIKVKAKQRGAQTKKRNRPHGIAHRWRRMTIIPHEGKDHNVPFSTIIDSDSPIKIFHSRRRRKNIQIDSLVIADGQNDVLQTLTQETNGKFVVVVLKSGVN